MFYCSLCHWYAQKHGGVGIELDGLHAFLCTCRCSLDLVWIKLNNWSIDDHLELILLLQLLSLDHNSTIYFAVFQEWVSRYQIPRRCGFALIDRCLMIAQCINMMCYCIIDHIWSKHSVSVPSAWKRTKFLNITISHASVCSSIFGDDFLIPFTPRR